MRDVAVFDRIAPLYDRVAAAWRVDAGLLAAGLARADGPVERVLDVGGGTGRAARALPAGTDPVVVDASSRMLARARRRGLDAVQGDAGTLPVRDGVADAVVVADALHHFPDAERAVREAARTLRPGGVLVVSEFDPTTVRGRLLAGAEHAVGFDSTFRSPAELARLLADAGLRPHALRGGFAYALAGVVPGE